MTALPPSMAGWDLAQRDDFEERAGIVADGCKLPQRCAEAEKRAEAITRERWSRGGDEAMIAALPKRHCP